MKSLKVILIGIAVPGLWLLSAAIVNAQAEGTVEPAQLRLAGQRGAVETRQIFVRTTNPIKVFITLPQLPIAFESLRWRQNSWAIAPTRGFDEFYKNWRGELPVHGHRCLVNH